MRNVACLVTTRIQIAAIRVLSETLEKDKVHGFVSWIVARRNDTLRSQFMVASDVADLGWGGAIYMISCANLQMQ